ncbi:MAG TPA: ABC transporter permease [Bryobacteraceae bacterium]|nr:ABC transporter permease [Bryobacteraceae bacterium]
MGTLLQDLRYGLRTLRDKPAFTATAVLTLALGIAVTTVVFSWIDMVLLHPLPGTTNGEQLYIFESKQPDAEGLNISYPDFRDYRDHLKLSSVALAFQNNPLSIGDGDHAERVWAELVSGNYFDVLGVKPLIGRFFLPEEQGDTAGGYPVAIISARLWQSRFHADPHVLGSTIRVNRRDLTIVGVAPPEFYGMMRGLAYEMWIPLVMGPQLNRFDERVLQQRPPRMFNAIARVHRGASIEQARAEAEALARELAAKYPKTNEGFGVTLLPETQAHGTERNHLVGPLWTLMTMCSVVLLIACVNVANLLMARGVSRRNELAIRLAVGASRSRIVRQLLTEALLLAILAAAAGAPLAGWMAESIEYLAPVTIGIPIQIQAMSLNWEILGFTVLVSILTALLSGMSPALHAIGPNASEAMNEGGRGGVSGVRSQRLRDFFVVCEVALAFVALIGAGLFLKNFQIAKAIDPGFDARHVLVCNFYTSMAGYSEEQRRAFCVRLRERLLQAPGIESVSYADLIPLGFGLGPSSELQIEGYVPARTENMAFGRTLVAPGYFSLLRVPLLSGRDFTDRDDPDSAPVAIVNEPFARRFFAGRSAVGQKIFAGGKAYTVVGLVRGTKYYTLTEPPRPYFYVPIQQAHPPQDIAFYLRTSDDPMQAIQMLRREAAAVDPNAGVFDAMPLTDYIGAPLFSLRFAATLLSALGAMSLFLAAVGLYSVMAYTVSQRIHEIGIRLALGARPRDVLSSVVRKSIALTALGVLGGAAAALAAGRAVSGMLSNVSTADPLIFAGTSLFLISVTLLAGYLPARRASKVDPIVALRHQ